MSSFLWLLTFDLVKESRALLTSIMGFLLKASIVLLSLCGVALSYYAIHIAAAKHSDETFQPSCDVDETISCSHALLSE